MVVINIANNKHKSLASYLINCCERIINTASNIIINKHFLSFIRKPATLELSEKFGYEDIESTKVSNIFFI